MDDIDAEAKELIEDEFNLELIGRLDYLLTVLDEQIKTQIFKALPVIPNDESTELERQRYAQQAIINIENYNNVKRYIKELEYR